MNEYNNTEEFEGSEQELAPLLDAIRSEGMPYADTDERYFGTFRTRVMQRVAVEEARKQPWFVKVGSWLRTSPFRASMIGLTTAAALVLGVVTMNSNVENPQLAQSSTKVTATNQNSSGQTETAQQSPAVQMPTNTSASEPAVSETASNQGNGSENIAKLDPKTTAVQTPNTSEHSAIVQQVPTTSEIAALETNGPVSINDLSADDLEGLLASLESAN